MTKTGVKCDADTLASLRKLAQTATQTPVMCCGGVDFAASARERALKASHEAALKAGLPEIRGYYGVDEAGEFVTA